MAPVGCMCLMWYFLVVAIDWSIVSLSKTNLVSSKQRDTQNTDVSTAGKSTAFWTPSHGGGWLIFLLKLGGFLGSFLRSFFSGVVPPSASFGFNPATKIRFQSPFWNTRKLRFLAGHLQILWWMFCLEFRTKYHQKHTSKICRWLSPRWCAWQWELDSWLKWWSVYGEKREVWMTFAPLWRLVKDDQVSLKFINPPEFFGLFHVICRTQVNYLYLVFTDFFWRAFWLGGLLLAGKNS